MGVLPILVNASLWVTGLTQTGVRGGAIAGGRQSSIGNVAAGSFFAQTQFLAATGGLSITDPMGLATTVIVLAANATYKE